VAAGESATAPDLARPTVRGERARGRTNARARLELLVVPTVLLVLWQLGAAVIGGSAAATPAETVEAIVEGFRDGWLLEALEATAVATLLSFAVAAVLGLFVGFLLGLHAFLRDVFEAPLLWVYSIPKITLYPVFLLLLGLTLNARIAFAVFHGFIPLALFVLNGVRSTPDVYLKVARVYRLPRRKLLTRIVLPSSLSAVVVGMRYCFSLTFLGLIFAEMFAAREGMGYELLQSISLHRVPRTFGIGLVLVLVALAVNAAFLRLERVVATGRAQPR
jgi:NitT/TauT family transport system permease protein